MAHILDFVQREILGGGKATLKDEFFHLALNSPLGERNYCLDEFPLLKQSNPAKKEFYFVLKTQDFFLNEKVQEETHFFQIVDKYYVIRSFYPFAAFFERTLRSFKKAVSQAKLDKLVQMKQDLSDPRVLATLIDCSNILPQEISLAKALSKELGRFVMKDISFKMEFKFENQVLIHSSPHRQHLALCESEIYFHCVLSRLAFEEFLLLLFAIVNEYSLVVVS